MRRLRRHSSALAAAGLVLLVLAVLGVSVDARHRRSRRDAQQAQLSGIAQRLPFADLALSGGSRWLRAPSVEEPMGAFADAPGVPDPDPAGAFLSPAGASR